MAQKIATALATATDDATPGELLGDYRLMLLIRRFEEKTGQLYGMGVIGGFCHLYIGQEAVAVGMQASVMSGDSIITGYRDHAHMLAAGLEPKRIMAELAGNSDGYSRGKGGSMHMFGREAGFYGGHGIVGAQVPLGSGLAFAHKYRGDGGISFVYFGDGAANQGQVFEAFNMASLWQLPVLFIIENNGYAMGSSVARSSAITELYKRCQGFNIPARRVDGMDLLAVRAAGAAAAAQCRGGKGPYLLEMMTYRYRGHSMSDPASYRAKEEVREMKKDRDPIASLRSHLLTKGMADEQALKDIAEEVKSEVAEAARFAQAGQQPAADELFTDVLVQQTGERKEYPCTA